MLTHRQEAQFHGDPGKLSDVLLTEHDIYHFREGTFFRAYEKLGAHPATHGDSTHGTHFAVWAPNASAVSVIGDFNHWQRGRDRLTPRGDSSGIWEGAVQGVGAGALYKYHVVSRRGGYAVDKSDGSFTPSASSTSAMRRPSK